MFVFSGDLAELENRRDPAALCRLWVAALVTFVELTESERRAVHQHVLETALRSTR